jgi:hypothetical protein
VKVDANGRGKELEFILTYFLFACGAIYGGMVLY